MPAATITATAASAAAVAVLTACSAAICASSLSCAVSILVCSAVTAAVVVPSWVALASHGATLLLKNPILPLRIGKETHTTTPDVV
jgi:hypothetical protein